MSKSLIRFRYYDRESSSPAFTISLNPSNLWWAYDSGNYGNGVPQDIIIFEQGSTRGNTMEDSNNSFYDKQYEFIVANKDDVIVYFKRNPNIKRPLYFMEAVYVNGRPIRNLGDR